MMLAWAAVSYRHGCGEPTRELARNYMFRYFFCSENGLAHLRDSREFMVFESLPKYILNELLKFESFTLADLRMTRFRSLFANGR